MSGSAASDAGSSLSISRTRSDTQNGALVDSGKSGLGGILRGKESLLQSDEPEADEEEDDEFGLCKDFRLVQALNKPADQRQERDLKAIFNAVQTIDDPFILRLEDGVKKAICRKLTLEEYEPGDKIFEYGDAGDKLYLIWSGRVLIEVPRQAEKGPGDKNAGDKFSKPLELVKVGNFDAGKAFGELALMHADNRRNARVSAVKPTQLLALAKDDYRWCVGFSQESFVRERVKFLLSVERAVLEGAKETDLEAMAGHLREERYAGGQVICRQGEEVDRVIFVKSGFCKVMRYVNPRYREVFDLYADRDGPPPNPIAVGSAGRSIESLAESNEVVKKFFANGMRQLDIKAAKALECGAPGQNGGQELELGFRDALERLLGKNLVDATAKSTKPEPSRSKGLPPTPTRRTELGKSARTEAVSARDTVSSKRPHARSGRQAGGTSDQAADGVCLDLQPLGAAARPESQADNDAVVVADILQAGRAFGVMEMMEGLTYQFSVVADPWAEVYVVTKYDLVRNTSKHLLHRLFCDYKARLSDERLLRRLRQKCRWNNYKKDLLDEIRNRKTAAQRMVVRGDAPTRRTGGTDLSVEDYERIGKGEKMWDGRAQTPPRPAYVGKGESEVQHIFRIHCVRSEDGAPNVEVEREVRDASMAALDEKILQTIARAREREKNRRANLEEKSASEKVDSLGQDGLQALPSITSPRRPDSSSGPSPRKPGSPQPSIRKTQSESVAVSHGGRITRSVTGGGQLGKVQAARSARAGAPEAAAAAAGRRPAGSSDDQGPGLCRNGSSRRLRGASRKGSRRLGSQATGTSVKSVVSATTPNSASVRGTRSMPSATSGDGGIGLPALLAASAA
eukprot:TRINITY_DN29726_c0_g1_i1.p1 TRINITY_DN29726_c0_g1~~TRINITY_DN29726_c0_g1_i1.p1  ORF type:complete len:854 (+),score=205.07 TRINITY_DN29726_c0_g1_i1:145-2706(+)